MIRAIIFDFYGVICYEVGSNWYKTRPPKELISELKEKYDAPSDLGTISEEEFFSGIAPSVRLTGKEVRTEWLNASKIDEELVSFIRQLKTTHKIAICSNTAPKIFRETLQANNIEDAFDIVVSSSEIGMIKPNPDIYLYTLKELGVKPEEAIFIDDRESNLEGARAVGINSILYVNLQQIKSDLDKFL
jgi:putative hydrolase of the HAD superfamily